MSRVIPSSRLRRRVDAHGLSSMASRIVSTLSCDGWPTWSLFICYGPRAHKFVHQHLDILLCWGWFPKSSLKGLSDLPVRLTSYMPDNNCNLFFYCKHSGTCKRNAIPRLEVKNILGLYRHPVVGWSRTYSLLARIWTIGWCDWKLAFSHEC